MPIVCTNDFEKNQATDRLNFIVNLATLKIELDILVKPCEKEIFFYSKFLINYGFNLVYVTIFMKQSSYSFCYKSLTS
jgi:hypothetical protein